VLFRSEYHTSMNLNLTPSPPPKITFNHPELFETVFG
jgi:hypothetical protein